MDPADLIILAENSDHPDRSLRRQSTIQEHVHNWA